MSSGLPRTPEVVYLSLDAGRLAGSSDLKLSMTLRLCLLICPSGASPTPDVTAWSMNEWVVQSWYQLVHAGQGMPSLIELLLETELTFDGS